MKKCLKPLSVLILAASLYAGGCHSTGQKQDTVSPDSSSGIQSAEQAMYVCPMDTDIKSTQPGNCSKCGMPLEKK